MRRDTITGLSAATLLTALAGCSPAPFPVSYVQAVTGIELSTGPLVPAFQADRTGYEVESLNTRNTLRIRVTSAEAGSFLMNGKPQPVNTWVEFRVNAIAPDAFITVQANEAATPYRIATQPADFPVMKITARTPVKGDVLLAPRLTAVNPQGANYLLMLNEFGQTQYYKRTTANVNDFKTVRGPDGKRRYLYHEAPTGNFMGMRYRLMNDQFEVIRDFQLLPAAGRPAFPADVHDVTYVNDDHVVLLGYYPKKVTNIPGKEGQPTNMLASVIQEQQGGQVVFDWDSTDHPELYGTSVENQAFGYMGENYPDYAHVNSVVFDPKDGNLVASFRNLDGVLKINRADGLVLWTLGGPGDDFGLTEQQKIYRQHQATYISPTRLLLFDNGNTAGRSRVVEYELDEQSRKVRDFKSVEPQQPRLSPFMGSVQKVSASRYFIGWGGHPAVTAAPNLTEMDAATGEVHFSLSLPEKVWSYRAQKVTDR